MLPSSENLGTASGNVSQNTGNQADFDLSKLLAIVLRNKWIILLCLVLGGAGAYTWLHYQIPVYQAEGTMFISENKSNYSSDSELASLLSASYGLGATNTLANELVIIKSRRLSMQLADTVLSKEELYGQQDYPILWTNYPENPSLATREQVAMRIRNGLNVEKDKQGTDLVRVSFKSISPVEAAYMTDLIMNSYSSFSTQQNREMTSSALKFLLNEKENLEDKLRKSEQDLEDFMNKTELITVDAQTNTLINTISTLESRKQELSVQLVAINSAIDSYKKELEAFKPGLADQFSQAIGPKIQSIQFVLSELETQKLLLLSKNPELKDQPNHPKLQEIDNRIAEARGQIKDITERLLNADSDLSLALLNTQGGNVATNIIELNQKLTELSIQQSQIKTQVDVLENQITELNANFDNLPRDIIQMARLQRDVRTQEELYLVVSNQYAEMSLWERTQFGLGRPLDYAVIPSSPISPDRLMILLIGFVFGGVLGGGIAFLRSMFNDTIYSSDEIKKMAVPHLGNIPQFDIMEGKSALGAHKVKGKAISKQLMAFIDQLSPISEAFRRMRINIVYANPDKQYKTLMVTSTNKGEGKSTITANLSVPIAESERRVLIIDLDLRRPSQHRVFGELREPGLTDVLFDSASFSAVRRRTVVPNVDLITVGKKTNQPSSVLDSKRLKALIDHVKGHYDQIILDTAPFGLIADSASLLRLVDGTIVVSQFGQSTQKEFKHTIEELRTLKADIVGTVLNRFNPKKSTDYYKNYNYYKQTYGSYYSAYSSN